MSSPLRDSAWELLAAIYNNPETCWDRAEEDAYQTMSGGVTRAGLNCFRGCGAGLSEVHFGALRHAGSASDLGERSILA
jgi:hypothetical protein